MALKPLKNVRKCQSAGKILLMFCVCQAQIAKMNLTAAESCFA